MTSDGTANLVWMDLEMTGLDPEDCTILEIATLITDPDLNVVAEGPVLAIRHTVEQLEAMDEWNRTHHRESGLWARVVGSEVSLADAEQETLAFLKLHVPERSSPLCGNSIGQDRRFLYKYMPALSRHLHYRNVDVSSIKELARRWYPSLPPFAKNEVHLALDDIRESIAELQYYRKRIFRPEPAD